MFQRTPENLTQNEGKDDLYELACECTVGFFKEAQALEIIDKMFKCQDCKKHVFLVAQVEEKD